MNNKIATPTPDPRFDQKLARQEAIHNDTDYLDFAAANQSVWTKYEGVTVLRVNDHKLVAAPSTGRKNSAKFDIINVETKEFLCQIAKKKTRSYLFKAWERDQDIESIPKLWHAFN